MRNLIIVAFEFAIGLVIGCSDFQRPSYREEAKNPVHLFLNGKRDEALEIAKNMQNAALFPDPQIIYKKAGHEEFSKGLIARHLQDDEQLAADYFKSAASLYLSNGKNREASLCLGEEAYSLMLVCKFKESQIILNKSLKLIPKVDLDEMPDFVKKIMEYDEMRKAQIQMVKSDKDIIKIMNTHENNLSTPPNLQFEFLNYFGKFWLSMMDYESAYFYFRTAKFVAYTQPVADKDKLSEVAKNLERVKSNLKK